MSLSVVQAKGNNSGSTVGGNTSAVGQLTSGPVQGNLLIAMVVSDTALGAATYTAPAGWTSFQANTNAQGIVAQLYYKAAGASEPSTWTWTLSTGDPWCVMVTEVTSAITTSAPQVAAASGLSATAATPTLTTTHTNELILGYVADSSAVTFTAPASTTRDAQTSTSAGLGANCAACEIRDNSLQASAGLTTSRSVTISASTGWQAFTVAVSDATVVLAPDAASGAFSDSAGLTAAQILAPSTAAGAFTDSGQVVAPAILTPATAAIAGAASAFLAVGPMPNWQYAFGQYKAGTRSATVLALGASIIEGYNVGSTLRTVDGLAVRAGTDLAQYGVNPSVHPGVFYATNWSTSTIVPAGSDPSGTDPWTRTGTVNNIIGLQGNSDITSQFFATNAGNLSITAPAWATHAVVHFNDNGGGNGIAIWTLISNGVTVLQHLMNNASTEQTVLVPLQGSGHTFAIDFAGGQLGSGNPAFNGVTFQQRLNAPITAMYTNAAHAISGGPGTISSLSSVSTGAQMLLFVGCDAATPALPSGWLSQSATTIGTHRYLVCSRVKQAGDTTVTITPSSGAIDMSLAAWNGAAIGQVSAIASGSASSTTITANSLAIASNTSWSVLAIGAGLSGATFTYPTGWTAQVLSNAAVAVGFAVQQNVGGSAVVVTPGGTTISSTAPDRVAWQIELVQSTTPVSENFIQVIENGHGGYEAYSYAFPTAGASPPLSQDTSFYWAAAIGAIRPDAIVFLDMGFNDLSQGRSTSDFSSAMTTVITKIDAACGYAPDLLMGMYTYLPTAPAAFSQATWDAWVSTMQTVAGGYGTRAKFFRLQDYIPAQNGTSTPSGFTSLEPGTVGTYVHPTALGDRYLGDIIAAELANSFTVLTPTATIAGSDNMNLLHFQAHAAAVTSGGLKVTQAHKAILDPDLSFTGTQNHGISTFRTGSLAFSGGIVRAMTRAFTGAASFTGSFIKETFIPGLAAMLGLVGLVGRGYGRNVVGALSFTGTRQSLTGRQLTGGLTSSGQISRAIGALVTGGLSFSGQLLRRLSYFLTAALSFTGAVLKGLRRPFTGTLSASGSRGAQTTHQSTGALTSSGSIQRGIGALLTGGLSFTGNVARTIAHGFIAALSFAGDLIAFNGTLHLSAGLGFSGTTRRGITFPSLTAVLSFTGRIVRGRLFTGAVAFTGGFKRKTTAALIAVLTSSGTTLRAIKAQLIAGLSYSGGTAHGLARAMTAALSFAGRMAKTPGKALSGAVSVAGAITRAMLRVFIGQLTPASGLGRSIRTPFTAAMSLTGAIGRQIPRRFPATLALSGHYDKLPNRALTATITPSGGIRRAMKRVVLAGLTPSGRLRRRSARLILGRLNVSGLAHEDADLSHKAIQFGSPIRFTGSLATKFRTTAYIIQKLGSSLTVFSAGTSPSAFTFQDEQHTIGQNPRDGS